MLHDILGWYNYWLIAVLILVGIYGMMAKRNLLKKLMGMNILQVSIILFFLTLSPKEEGSMPVFDAELASTAAGYANPLPQALMLTAIVVGVATTGLALALLVRVHRTFGTLEEDDIMEDLR